MARWLGSRCLQLQQHSWRLQSCSIDRRLDDTIAGQLLYTTDGSGVKSAIRFACLDTGFSMANANIWVI
jgi:hypothetical protein